MMPFHFQPGCDCKMCGSDTHATSRCPRKREFQALAHETCLQQWRDIQASTGSLRMNTKWLTAPRVNLIRDHLNIRWSEHELKSAIFRKQQVQVIYQYFAKCLANVPMDMTDPQNLELSLYNSYIMNHVVSRKHIHTPVSVTMEHGTETEFECPVCYDTVTQGVKTQCGHQFCEPCMSQVIAKSDHVHMLPCPMCRTGVCKMTSSSETICSHMNRLMDTII